MWKEIHKILWEDWDPIGVNDGGDWPDDEYSGYDPQIFQLKLNGADTETIAHELFKYETANMGMTGNMNICREVAKKIKEL